MLKSCRSVVSFGRSVGARRGEGVERESRLSKANALRNRKKRFEFELVCVGRQRIQTP